MGGASSASISANGRYVLFSSPGRNIVAAAGNGEEQLYVRDRNRRSTVRVSEDPNGRPANGWANGGTITGDGTVVVFTSPATNLVDGDQNGHVDVFLRMLSGSTYLVSVSSDDMPGDLDSFGAKVSPDGRYVVFSSEATTLVAHDCNARAGVAVADVFVRDLSLGRTALLSRNSAGVQGNDYSYHPFLSADGRFVLFDSYATSLVAGDTNGAVDVFRRGPLSLDILAQADVENDGTSCASLHFEKAGGAPGEAVTTRPQAPVPTP